MCLCLPKCTGTTCPAAAGAKGTPKCDVSPVSATLLLSRRISYAALNCCRLASPHRSTAPWAAPRPPTASQGASATPVFAASRVVAPRRRPDPHRQALHLLRRDPPAVTGIIPARLARDAAALVILQSISPTLPTSAACRSAPARRALPLLPAPRAFPALVM